MEVKFFKNRYSKNQQDNYRFMAALLCKILNVANKIYDVLIYVCIFTGLMLALFLGSGIIFLIFICVALQLFIFIILNCLIATHIKVKFTYKADIYGFLKTIAENSTQKPEEIETK